MAGSWIEGALTFEWDGDFEAPHVHTVSGQWAINYGQEDGSELATIRNDVRIDRVRVLGDAAHNWPRLVTILDADAQPMFELLQENGHREQVFELAGEPRVLSFSHVTWQINGEPRENDEFICEDHREMAGITYAELEPENRG